MAYKAADYIAAIHKHHGIITHVANALGVDRSAVYKARDRHPTVAQALEESRERIVDEAENALMGRIKQGDTTAIIFALKTLGKSRGYIERSEVEHSGGMTIEVVYVDED